MHQPRRRRPETEKKKRLFGVGLDAFVICFSLICIIISFASVKVQGSDLIDHAIFGRSFTVKNISVINSPIDVNVRFAIGNCLKVLGCQYFFFSDEIAEIAIGTYDRFTCTTSIMTIWHRVWNYLAEQINVVVNRNVQSWGFPRITENNLCRDWLPFFDFAKFGSFYCNPCTRLDNHLIGDNKESGYCSGSNYGLNIKRWFITRRRDVRQWLGLFCVLCGVVFWVIVRLSSF
jgi:hypothetical protein